MQALFEDLVFQTFGDPETHREIQKISFGWKIHIACDVSNFPEILSILKTQLEASPVVLKVLREPSRLNELRGTVQEGKAFTLYFAQDAETIRNQIIPLLNRLAESLSPMKEPSVRIQEEPLPLSPFLYYRYGDYNSIKNVFFQLPHPSGGALFFSRDGQGWLLDPMGRKWLIGPRQVLWMDRQPHHYKPEWVLDPFKELLSELSSPGEALPRAAQSRR